MLLQFLIDYFYSTVCKPLDRPTADSKSAQASPSVKEEEEVLLERISFIGAILSFIVIYGIKGFLLYMYMSTFYTSELITSNQFLS